MKGGGGANAGRPAVSSAKEGSCGGVDPGGPEFRLSRGVTALLCRINAGGRVLGG